VRCGAPLDAKSKKQCTTCLEKSRTASANSRKRNLEKVRKRDRLAMRAKRRANPKKYQKYRRAHYAKNREALLRKRRAKEGQVPRAEFLKQIRKATRPRVMPRASQKPLKVFIMDLLVSFPTLSSEQIAKRCLQKGLPCPYGNEKHWKVLLDNGVSTNDAYTKFIHRIRKEVGKQFGKPGRPRTFR
jgi:hypothetical protein